MLHVIDNYWNKEDFSHFLGHRSYCSDITEEAVLGWGPGFDLGPKNVYFGETYFKDQNNNSHIFGLITKM